jgi:hypothetical protein
MRRRRPFIDSLQPDERTCLSKEFSRNDSSCGGGRSGCVELLWLIHQNQKQEAGLFRWSDSNGFTLELSFRVVAIYDLFCRASKCGDMNHREIGMFGSTTFDIRGQKFSHCFRCLSSHNKRPRDLGFLHEGWCHKVAIDDAGDGAGGMKGGVRNTVAKPDDCRVIRIPFGMKCWGNCAAGPSFNRLELM